MNPNPAIAATFRRQLADMGVPVRFQDGSEIRALVTAGDCAATFGMGDQELTEPLSATCFRVDAPQTGEIVEIDGKRYAVQARTLRPTSPIARLELQLIPGELSPDDD